MKNTNTTEKQETMESRFAKKFSPCDITDAFDTEDSAFAYFDAIREFIRDELQSAIQKAQIEMLREVENILPYGAEFTDRFYTLKAKYISPVKEESCKTHDPSIHGTIDGYCNHCKRSVCPDGVCNGGFGCQHKETCPCACHQYNYAANRFSCVHCKGTETGTEIRKNI